MRAPILAVAATLSLAACLHTPVPIAQPAPETIAAPLEARIWASSIDGFVTVDLNRPAYVAIFEIQPGMGTRLLYPRMGQASLLAAGTQRPHLFAGAGSGRAYGSTAAYWSTPLGNQFAQPRHVFLVAADEPLRLDVVQALADLRSGALTTFRFASFSTNAVIEDLLDTMIPVSFSGDWTTDVFTIWPEVPFRRGSGIERVAVTAMPVWVTCNGTTFHLPAGSPLDVLHHHLNIGCTISAQNPNPGQKPNPEPPTADTTRQRAVPAARDTVGAPARPPMVERDAPRRATTETLPGHRQTADRELLEREPEQVRSARPLPGEGERSRPGMRERELPTLTAEQPRTVPQRVVPEPSRPRSEPAREAVDRERTRAEPTRQRLEETREARPTPAAARPRAEPTPREIERPRQQPARREVERPERPEPPRPRAEPARETQAPPRTEPRHEPPKQSPPAATPPAPRVEPTPVTEPPKKVEPPPSR